MRRLCLAFLFLPSPFAMGSDLDEFSIKREAVFEFTRKPAIEARTGDSVRFSFESRGYCDVTVAIEDSRGNILRHLACGVLGPKAPWPLQINSLAQALTWDLRDDLGNAVNPDSAVIRVSLGLKPEYEKDVYGDPKRRISPYAPLLAATPEGVYSFESYGQSNLILFDHNGDYVRTIYPFPADKLQEVAGLDWITVPQLSGTTPWKLGNWKSTFLNCNNLPKGYEWRSGPAATAMAHAGGRIALACQNLARLSSDGSGGGPALNGPAVFSADTGEKKSSPMDAAMSPDARKVYCTGFFTTQDNYPDMAIMTFLPVVTRMDYEGNAGGTVFAGPSTGLNLQVPTSVCCDSSGRVYVADYLGHCVYVLDTGGALLKRIDAAYPAEVRVNPRNQEIYVFSWFLSNSLTSATVINGTLVRFGAFGNPVPLDTVIIPQADYAAISQRENYGTRFRAELDPWTTPVTIWLGREKYTWSYLPYDSAGTLLLTPENGRMAVKRDFAADARRNVDNLGPWGGLTAFLSVNPKTGKLYVHERGAAIIEVDPGTKSHRRIWNPYFPGSPDHFVFGYDGLLYFRADAGDSGYVVRSASVDSFQEVPLPKGVAGRLHTIDQDATGVYRVPGRGDSNFSPGMSVSLKGKVAVSTVNPTNPRLYPGRPPGWHWGIKVWDESGNVIDSDAIAGIPRTFGLLVDDNLNVFVMDGGNRILDGTPYFAGRKSSNYTNTLLGCRAGRGRLLSTTTNIPLPADSIPAEPYDLWGMNGMHYWAKDIDWMYGGGSFGYASGSDGWLDCPCVQSNVNFDYFSRSFVPEPDIYRVAVLDSRGNLILRVGQYGNAESRGAGSGAPLGGDEVGLFHPLNVATLTDRRLYIADIGNLRVVSVKLGYHAEERVAAGDVSVEHVRLPENEVRLSLSPNPFSASTRVEYSTQQGGTVSLKVFNIRGGLVATLVNEKQAPGRRRASFTAGRMAAGCYLLRLETAGRKLERKAVVLR